jgi:hypothetical protein
MEPCKAGHLQTLHEIEEWLGCVSKDALVERYSANSMER